MLPLDPTGALWALGILGALCLALVLLQVRTGGELRQQRRELARVHAKHGGELHVERYRHREELEKLAERHEAEIERIEQRHAAELDRLGNMLASGRPGGPPAAAVFDPRSDPESEAFQRVRQLEVDALATHLRTEAERVGKQFTEDQLQAEALALYNRLTTQ